MQIVVGFDGSPNSVQALQLATTEAAAHGATLRIVHAWQGPGIWVDPYTINEQFEAAGRTAHELVQEAADRAELELGRRVVRHVENGSAVEVLLREAEDADLLVVGARGRGGFVGLVLGSVANQIAHHTPCPLLLVPCPDV